MTIRRVVIFLYHFGANLQPEGDSRRLLTGAKLSAAGGRSSEAEHGQGKEKSTRRVVFDYALPPLGL